MDLLERHAYLSELGDLLRQAAGGQGRLVFLGGEAGVGKTALVRRFCADARTAARVLTGACDPLSTPRPLGAVARRRRRCWWRPRSPVREVTEGDYVVLPFHFNIARAYR